MWPEGWRSGGASLGTGRLNNKSRVSVFIVSFQPHHYDLIQRNLDDDYSFLDRDQRTAIVREIGSRSGRTLELRFLRLARTALGAILRSCLGRRGLGRRGLGRRGLGRRGLGRRGLARRTLGRRSLNCWVTGQRSLSSSGRCLGGALGVGTILFHHSPGLRGPQFSAIAH